MLATFFSIFKIAISVEIRRIGLSFDGKTMFFVEI